MSLETRDFEFGEFLLEGKEKVLLRDGKPLPLTPKAFHLLFVLVENHGRIVEKEDLMQTVWADSFVEESNLTFTVSLLRKALGDDPKKPRFIETVSKRGYRFIADARRVEVEGGETGRKGEREKERRGEEENKIISLIDSSPLLPVSPSRSSGTVVALADWRNEAIGNKATQISSATALGESIKQTAGLESIPVKLNGEESKPASKYRLTTAAAVTLAILLVGVIGLAYYFSAGKPTADADGKKSIAVLPLKPIDPANRDEIYEVGIADSLIHRLSSIKGFIVRPLSATRKYADIEQDALVAGREQQVDYVLASNYQLANGKIRVTTQLFNVASGQIENTYQSSEKETGDVFAMQDAIAGEIGSSLLARFAAATIGTPTTRRGTTNEEAYRLYLQGMYLYAKRTPRASKKAVELLDQAVRLDPNYALAWAGKAHAHRYRGNLGRDTNTHEEYQNSAVALNEALLLDKDLSEAYSALCENKYYYEWDFTGAERACRQAIGLDSNSSMAHEIYGRYLSHQGRFDEAISELKIAVTLDPTSLFNRRNLGIAFYYAGRYEEAAAQFKEVLATDENFTSAYLWLRNTLEMQGDYREAFDWFLKAQKALNTDEATIQLYQTIYQTSGYQGVLREQADRFEKGNNQYYIGAILNAQAGNADKAFEYLEKSFQRREWGMNSLLVEPHLASLRDDPRFDKLVGRVGLK